MNLRQLSVVVTYLISTGFRRLGVAQNSTVAVLVVANPL